MAALKGNAYATDTRHLLATEAEVAGSEKSAVCESSVQTQDVTANTHLSACFPEVLVPWTILSLCKAGRLSSGLVI